MRILVKNFYAGYNPRMGFSAKKMLSKWLSGDKSSEENPAGHLAMTRWDDQQLMQAYQKGEIQAFSVLLSRHQKPLFNYLYRFLKSHQAAEDALQEVFLRVIRARGDYRPSAKFTTWLYTLARHYCIDEMRKKSHRDHASFEQENERLQTGKSVYSSDSFVNAASAHEVSSANELENRLEGLLNEMNPDQKEVFLMRELEGMSYEEIAYAADCSVNTAKSRMRYALQYLQKKLAELGIKKFED